MSGFNGGAVAPIQVVNNLTTTSAGYALDARQGKALDDSKVNKSDIVNDLTSTATDKPLSANMGKTLNDKFAVLQFATVTGTTAANTTDSVVVNYPDGFGHTNCIIIGHTIQFSNGAWFSNYENNYVFSNNIGINVKVSLVGFTNRPFKVTLMKITI